MKQAVLIAVVLILAAVGPNIFPAAEAGYSSMPTLAVRLLIPAIALLAILAIVLRRRQPVLTKALVMGAIAGAAATVALEVVRLIGFRLGYMPGNLPRLMGVLLLDRFAQGPSLASDVAGWAYHFWNGASFGIIYVLLFGTFRKWVGAAYGIAIGVGFMLSPVVKSMGVGLFGLQFSPAFPITVTLAHFAFGLSLAVIARRLLGREPSLVWSTVRQCLWDRQQIAAR